MQGPHSPAPPVDVQPASWRDLSSIRELEKLCFGRDAWPWIDTLAALTFPQTVRLKAVSDEFVVGFIFGDQRRLKRTGWIASIGVHPDYRRRGIGRTLLVACEDLLGMPRVRLSLRGSNDAALRLYQQAGYVRIDTWKRYYRDGEDAIIMEKVR
ncbi:MAG: GNAT family N-acetyltransferase [Anaerolineaceae bacterium]|nr:MAG: GNAT family N-acetyltransferase [Anaerolineaceae bacterium]